MPLSSKAPSCAVGKAWELQNFMVFGCVLLPPLLNGNELCFIPIASIGVMTLVPLECRTQNASYETQNQLFETQLQNAAGLREWRPYGLQNAAETQLWEDGLKHGPSKSIPSQKAQNTSPSRALQLCSLQALDRAKT